MIRSTECPDAGRLRDLLDGMLAEPESTGLTRHLDECPECQARLETLAVGAEVPGDVRQLGRWRSEVGPSLQRVMSELTRGVAQAEIDTRPETPLEEPILDFLIPSDHPGSLGRFGPYEVLEVLGHGGMGVVLRALDPGLNRIAALKVLAPQLAASGAARKRFGREAKAAAAVEHENVVAIHAVDVAQGLPYLVMEYVAGESLEQRLRRSGPLELEEALDIAAQTARGLAAAHECGVIHRDVKPANILIADCGLRIADSQTQSAIRNPQSAIKLTDFGLARAIDDGTVTQSGFLPGTPAYMAPEQASGEAADHRADLFSLGSVMYALATARPPFSASTLFALLRRVSEEEPIPIQTLNPSIPNWLVEIMKKLHAKSPDARFQSAAETADVLEQCLAHVRQPATTPLPWFLRHHQPRPRRSQRRGLVAVLVMLALFGAGLWAANTLRVKTPQGTLIVEVHDPKVNVTVDGQDVLISGEGIAEVRLKAGQYKVEANKDGKPVLTKLIEIKKDGKEVVRVSLEPAVAAVVPPVPRTHTILRGHAGNVRSLIFSPDGKLLASGGADKEVRIWDAATGKELRRTQPAGPVVAISFFPDGKVMVTVGADGTIQLWDVATGKALSSVKLPGSIKLSAGEPSGRVWASVSDGKVRVWDLTSGRERATLEMTMPKVYGLAVSPDGSRVATAQPDAVVVVGIGDGKERLRLPTTLKTVRSLAYTPDGRRLLVVGEELRCLDAQTGQVLPMNFRVHLPTATAQSPDGKLIATGDASGLVVVTAVGSGEQVFSHQEEKGPISVLAFSPDGKQLAWAVPTGEIRLSGLVPVQSREPTVEQYQQQILALEGMLKRLKDELDATRSEAEKQRKTAELERARALLQETMAKAAAERALHEEMRAQQSREQQQRLLYARQLYYAQQAWSDGQYKSVIELLEKAPPHLRQWEYRYLKDLTSGAESSRKFEGHTAPVRAVAFSPDGKSIASGDGALRVWDPTSGKAVLLANSHTDSIEGLAFSVDGKQLATAGRDGKLAILDLATAKEVLTLGTQKQGPAAVAYSPDGRHIAWAYSGGPLSVIEATSGKKLIEIPERKGRVLSLAFSPDGKSLAATGEDLSLQVIDVATGGIVRLLTTGDRDQRGLAFRPDGKVVASAGLTSGRVWAWDAATGRTLYTIDGAKGETCLAFSPDGQRLVTGGADNKVKLWDAANGQPLLTLTGHSRPVSCVAFSPDGTVIVSGSEDKTLRIWPGANAPK